MLGPAMPLDQEILYVVASALGSDVLVVWAMEADTAVVLEAEDAVAM